MSDPIEAVLAALNAHDVEAFVACYTPGATIEDGEGRILAGGHAGIRERYEPMFELHPDLHVQAVSRIDVGAYVVEEERVTGRSPEPERHVAVYTVREGLIVRERLLR